MALRTAALRTGVDNKAGGGRDRENQACKGHGRVREGEDTPKLDQVEREDIEATREGEDTPELDQGERGDIEATREGEDTPELDQVDQGDIEPDGNMNKDNL